MLAAAGRRCGPADAAVDAGVAARRWCRASDSRSARRYALNGRILGYTALACLLAALISGVSPALFVFHSNLNEVLKEGSRSDTAGAASRRTRSLLVIGEVALATVALVGAGLFMRSFRNIRAIHPGFDAEQRSLRAVFHRDRGLLGRPDRTVRLAVEGAYAGGSRSRDGQLYRFRAAEHHGGSLELRAGGRLHAGEGRIYQRQPRAGVAGLLCDDADSPARRPRFHDARRAEGGARHDRQPGVRQAFLPRAESVGT